LSPGCSPTIITVDPRLPSPKTVCVAFFQRSQPRHLLAASRRLGSDSSLGRKSAAEMVNVFAAALTSNGFGVSGLVIVFRIVLLIDALRSNNRTGAPAYGSKEVVRLGVVYRRLKPASARLKVVLCYGCIVETSSLALLCGYIEFGNRLGLFLLWNLPFLAHLRQLCV
jgi:hypothetical protein